MMLIVLHFGEDNFTITVNVVPNEVPKIFSTVEI